MGTIVALQWLSFCVLYFISMLIKLSITAFLIHMMDMRHLKLREYK